nr:MAG TPA: hypothetical protein [Caudoviricetes sp.]
MNCTHRREDDKKPVCIHTMFTKHTDTVNT